MYVQHKTPVDAETMRAASAFIGRVSNRYSVSRAILFGSRARGAFRPDSDVDLAVLLQGHPGQRMDAALDMAGIAFDVLLETGVLVEALPLWEEEWEHPEKFNNPALIENIRREGVRL
jgi:predicted nucleotidyltransferase